jgi:hypothetical protein
LVTDEVAFVKLRAEAIVLTERGVGINSQQGERWPLGHR